MDEFEDKSLFLNYVESEDKYLTPEDIVAIAEAIEDAEQFLYSRDEGSNKNDK